MGGNIDSVVDALVAASGEEDLPLPTSIKPDLTLDEAYAVQFEVARRREGAGDLAAGRKVAMVSPEKQRQSGATEPTTGRLFRSNQIPSGGTLVGVVGDRGVVECELAFILAKDLSGPDVTEEGVLAATGAIVPAFDIVERRIPADAAMADRIAVNYGVAGFVLGTNQVDPRTVDRVHTPVDFEVDGQLSSTGELGTVLGDPARSVVWLANRLAGFGLRLHAEEVVLTGTIVPALPATAGRAFRATHGAGLGSVEVTGLG